MNAVGSLQARHAIVVYFAALYTMTATGRCSGLRCFGWLVEWFVAVLSQKFLRVGLCSCNGRAMLVCVWWPGWVALKLLRKTRSFKFCR